MSKTRKASEGAVRTIADDALVMVVGAGGYQPVRFADLMTAVRDGIQVGGRNLLTGSATGNGWLQMPTDGVYERTTSSSTEATIIGPIISGLETGKMYTVSLYAKATSNMRSMDVWLSAIEGGVSKININVTTEWKRYILTYTIAEGKKLNSVFRIDNNGSTNGQPATLWVKDIKVEEGNIATAWTPAPEDLSDSRGGVIGYLPITYNLTEKGGAHEQDGEALRSLPASWLAVERGKGFAPEKWDVTDCNIGQSPRSHVHRGKRRDCSHKCREDNPTKLETDDVERGRHMADTTWSSKGCADRDRDYHRHRTVCVLLLNDNKTRSGCRKDLCQTNPAVDGGRASVVGCYHVVIKPRKEVAV